MKKHIIFAATLTSALVLAGCDKTADAPAKSAPSTDMAGMEMGTVAKTGSGSGTITELDASAGQHVERGDALRDARRVVDRGQRLHDAVSETDPLRALRRRGEEDLGRARVRVLLEEVVLDQPHAVEAEAVGELDLLERLGEHAPVVAVVPRTRNLMLVEDPEFHGASLGGEWMAGVPRWRHVTRAYT